MRVGLLAMAALLLLLDRWVEKKTIVLLLDRLSYFLLYYRPSPNRRQFAGLVLGVWGVSILFDYLLTGELKGAWGLLILPVLVAGVYLLVFLLAVLDAVILGKGTVSLNFFIFERDLLTQFTLALLLPLFCLAQVVRGVGLLFLYPDQGILRFRSLAGLAGAFLGLLGIAAWFL